MLITAEVNITMTEKLLEVDIDEISVNPHQPRRYFAQEELQELAASIVEIGLLQPPVVRLRQEGEGYELIAGERRFRASQLAGLKKIPVLVRCNSSQFSAQAALIENIQRVDLNPMEIAKALRNLTAEYGYNQEELAQRIGKKRSTVANYLRLLALPSNIQDSILKGAISLGHAKVILSLTETAQQRRLHDLILSHDLTVRQAEAAVQRIETEANPQSPHANNRDCHLEQLAEKLQHRLGVKVVIEGRGQHGRIQIDYYNLDDLDRILEILDVKID